MALSKQRKIERLIDQMEQGGFQTLWRPLLETALLSQELTAEELRAHDGSGLQLLDKDGNLGLHVKDGGKIGAASGTGINKFSTDTTLAGASDDVVPTEKVVKTYSDARLAEAKTYTDTNLSGVRNVDSYGGLEAAITAIGSTPTTLMITTAQTLTANRELVSTLGIIVSMGGSIDGAYTLTISGPFTGAIECFGTSVTVLGLSYAMPEWWGANTIPGTTDMTAEINAAAAASRIVDISPEINLISSSVTIDVTKTRITGVELRSIIKASSAFSGLQMILVDAVTGVIIENITLDGNSTGGASDYMSGIITNNIVDSLTLRHLWIKGQRFDGIWVADPASGSSVKINIEKCIIEDIGWTGIYVEDSDNVIIDKCMVISTGYDGIYIGTSCKNVDVTKNFVTKATPPSFIYDGAGGFAGVEKGFLISYETNIANLLIDGNTVVDNETAAYDAIGIQNEDGVGTNIANARITNNSISKAGLFGIDCASNMVVSGNTIDGAVTAGIYIGLDLGGYIRNLTVSANTVKNITGGTGYSIQLGGAPTSGTMTYVNVAITGNAVGDDAGNITDYGVGIDTDSGLYGVLIASNNFSMVSTASIIFTGGEGGASRDVKFYGNELRVTEKAVSGTNFDSSGYEFFTMSQGGATNFTHMTHGVMGDRKIIRFADGNSTVVSDWADAGGHGTDRFVGNAGVNFSAAAGDAIDCYYTGVYWLFHVLDAY